jgi:TM2 domain-containing membrane protein YozV
MTETGFNSNSKAGDEKYCMDCGSLIKLKAEICPKCGVRQMAAPASSNIGAVAPNGKSKIAAALFAIFLGWMGAHKFYLGDVGWGVVYLLFFWTGIPAFVGFIEFILLLTMSDEAFNQKYGQV